MVRVPTDREPTHPGEMLLEEFLVPMGVSQRELADAIHVPYQRVNELVNGRRGITPSTALRLGRFLQPAFRGQQAVEFVYRGCGDRHRQHQHQRKGAKPARFIDCHRHFL